jgi:hypothetical protein
VMDVTEGSDGAKIQLQSALFTYAEAPEPSEISHVLEAE